MATIQVNTYLDEDIAKLHEICNKLDEAEKKVRFMKFLTIEDIMEATGWSYPTVFKLFHRKDFPATNIGKKLCVELDAAKNYFSVRRWND